MAIDLNKIFERTPEGFHTTPHFLNYKTATQHMVKSLSLLETDPIALTLGPLRQS
jgi:hypothetical protein